MKCGLSKRRPHGKEIEINTMAERYIYTLVSEEVVVVD
jgi:hypothetical protein